MNRLPYFPAILGFFLLVLSFHFGDQAAGIVGWLLIGYSVAIFIKNVRLIRGNRRVY